MCLTSCFSLKVSRAMSVHLLPQTVELDLEQISLHLEDNNFPHRGNTKYRTSHLGFLRWAKCSQPQAALWKQGSNGMAATVGLALTRCEEHEFHRSQCFPEGEQFAVSIYTSLPLAVPLSLRLAPGLSNFLLRHSQSKSRHRSEKEFGSSAESRI